MWLFYYYPLNEEMSAVPLFCCCFNRRSMIFCALKSQILCLRIFFFFFALTSKVLLQVILFSTSILKLSPLLLFTCLTQSKVCFYFLNPFCFTEGEKEDKKMSSPAAKNHLFAHCSHWDLLEVKIDLFFFWLSLSTVQWTVTLKNK